MRITLDTDDDSQVHALVSAIRRQAHPPAMCPHHTQEVCAMDSMREALLNFGRTEAGLQGLSAQAIREGRV